MFHLPRRPGREVDALGSEGRETQPFGKAKVEQGLPHPGVEDQSHRHPVRQHLYHRELRIGQPRDLAGPATQAIPAPGSQARQLLRQRNPPK